MLPSCTPTKHTLVAGLLQGSCPCMHCIPHRPSLPPRYLVSSITDCLHQLQAHTLHRLSVSCIMRCMLACALLCRYKDCTQITVDSANRPGTLIEVVQLLTELGLNVIKARISSDGGWFVDEFHVQEDKGPLKSERKKRAIEKVSLWFSTWCTSTK